MTILFAFYKEKIHIFFQFHFTVSNPQWRYKFPIVFDMKHIDCHIVILLKLCKIIDFHWHGTSFKIILIKKLFILCWLFSMMLINLIIMLRSRNAVLGAVFILILRIDDSMLSHNSFRCGDVSVSTHRSIFSTKQFKIVYAFKDPS